MYVQKCMLKIVFWSVIQKFTLKFELHLCGPNNIIIIDYLLLTTVERFYSQRLDVDNRRFKPPSQYVHSG